MKQMRILIFLFLLFSALGCATTPFAVTKEMRSWEGRSRSELISSYGSPAYTEPDGKGGTIFVYKYRRVDPPGRITAMGYDAIRKYYIDSKGTIYAWNWGGL